MSQKSFDDDVESAAIELAKCLSIPWELLSDNYDPSLPEVLHQLGGIYVNGKPALRMIATKMLRAQSGQVSNATLMAKCAKLQDAITEVLPRYQELFWKVFDDDPETSVGVKVMREAIEYEPSVVEDSRYNMPCTDNMKS